jgi:hypothetical protein
MLARACVYPRPRLIASDFFNYFERFFDDFFMAQKAKDLLGVTRKH